MSKTPHQNLKKSLSAQLSKGRMRGRFPHFQSGRCKGKEGFIIILFFIALS